jgi:hypothetical protein
MSDFLFGSTQVKSGNGYASWLYTSKFVCGKNGDATEIQIYSDSSGEAKVALYTDNAGSPGTVIVKNDSGTAVTGGQWNAISISSTTVTAGTTYWIAAISNATGVVTNKSGVATSKYNVSYPYGSFTFPSTFPSTSDIGVELLFAVYGIDRTPNPNFLFGSTETPVANNSFDVLYSTRFTCELNCVANEVRVWTAASVNSEVKVAIYDDDGGVPDKLLSSNDSGTAVSGGASGQWNVISIPDVILTKNIHYWIAVIGLTVGSSMKSADVGSSSRYTSGYTYSTFTFPGTYPASSSDGSEHLLHAFGKQSVFGSTQITPSGTYGSNTVYATKFTADRGGYIIDVGMYVANTTNVKVAIYSDNAGSPDVKLGDNSDGTPLVGSSSWKRVTLSSPIYVSNGTDYWLAIVDEDGGCALKYVSPVDSVYASTGGTYADFSFPSSFPSPTSWDQQCMMVAYGYITYSDTLGIISGYGTFGNIDALFTYGDKLGTISGSGTIGSLRETENYKDDLGTISGSGVFGNIDGVLTNFIRPLNTRARTHYAEILYGCIFADNFSSRSLIDKNNGVILNGDDLDFNSKNGLISDGVGKISYSAISIVSNSIVMSFRITSGGILIASADLTEGVPSDGWCIWVDGDGVHANNSDGAIIATECFVDGDFLDNEYHVVTYIIDLDNNIHILYVDNESDEQSTLISDPIAASASIFVAGFSSNNIVGNISGLRIYNKILTESDHNAYAS